MEDEGKQFPEPDPTDEPEPAAPAESAVDAPAPADTNEIADERVEIVTRPGRSPDRGGERAEPAS
jgi:hypothetical protein